MSLDRSTAARIGEALGLETGRVVDLRLRNGETRRGTIQGIAWKADPGEPLAVILKRPLDGQETTVLWHAIDIIDRAAP